jgi:hypothetical protein
VEYWGYLTSNLKVNSAGVTELFESLLTGDDEIPSWVISGDIADLPAWFPIEYTAPEPIGCGQCGSNVPVTEILTPLREDVPARWCNECWKNR